MLRLAADPAAERNRVIAMDTSTLQKPIAGKTKPRQVRAGRPPKELAGEVDARIVGAARQIFLQRGFEGASIDEIAEVARSGKRTIYARFRDKRALFAEVVMQDILSRIAGFKVDVPAGVTVEERLTSAATTLLHWVLDAERIALMRMVIGEARRFPDLAASVNQSARKLSTELGAHLLHDLTQSDEFGSLRAFAPERLATTARLFLDIIAVPILLRALFQVDVKVLDPEIDEHVARGVAFFVAACRNDGVAVSAH